MIFVYKSWNNFCKQLADNGIHSIPAREVSVSKTPYTVFKHDVETNVESAYEIATIEHKHGHRGSYYVQAYLLDNEKNIELLRKMQQLGHEISYHYDVLDECKGDFENAAFEFELNKNKFEENGFILKTLCQHGNPVIQRVGYTSNRDFFRNFKTQELYPHLSDIMVDFKQKYSTDYIYISDAGRKFKHIWDPINNDIVNSDDKNVAFDNLDVIFDKIITSKDNFIISIHPHRWQNSAVIYLLKFCFFKAAKFTTKILMKIPLLKRIISKYYYLAKKI